MVAIVLREADDHPIPREPGTECRILVRSYESIQILLRLVTHGGKQVVARAEDFLDSIFPAQIEIGCGPIPLCRLAGRISIQAIRNFAGPRGCVQVELPD